MKNKRFWLGMLVLALAFGMTVVGCEEEPDVDTDPSPPTGLAGTAVSSTSIQLTWNAIGNADTYTVEYNKNGTTATERKTATTAACTVDGLVPATKYDFKVAVTNTDGYTSDYSAAVSVETKAPATGNISISGLTTRETSVGTGTNSFGYQIGIFLKLSEGTYWNTTTPTADIAKAWAPVTGITLTSWNSQVDYNPALDKSELILWYTISGQSAITIPAGGITASIEHSKLTEIKGYTNATDSITVGTPASATSSAWATTSP